MPAKHQPLPYSYEALEPHIDETTMKLHHGKHYLTYVEKYNEAIKDTKYEHMNVDEVLTKIDETPENKRTAIRNHGGGASNHEKFWEIMSPEKTTPEEDLKEALEQTYGSIEEFKKEFTTKALNHFGSGWAWLVNDKGTLTIITTNNQDSPISQGKTPIIMLDVWEHGYYLKHQNRRAEYIEAWWNVINWEAATKNYRESQKT